MIIKINISINTKSIKNLTIKNVEWKKEKKKESTICSSEQVAKEILGGPERSFVHSRPFLALPLNIETLFNPKA